MEATTKCPVCATAFASEAGAAFALHVADCTTPPASFAPSSSSGDASSSAPSSSFGAYHAVVVDGIARHGASPASMDVKSCPRCQHVYVSGTAEYVVESHEFECARVNALESERSVTAATARQGKRAREPASKQSAAAKSVSSGNDVTASEAAEMAAEADDVPSVALFPAQCTLCGSGGRALLHCSGSCARVFHTACVDTVQPGNSKVSSSVTRVSGKAAAQWKCAECVRSVHRCQLCGFLGHESNTLQKCSIVDCGFFFHASCLVRRDGECASPLICPRHTCKKCKGVETDMRACQSCVKCFNTTHLRCPAPASTADSANGASAPPLTRGSSLSDTNLHICDAHAPASTASSPTARGGTVSSTPSSSKPNAEETIALKYRVQQGDIVLILELANAILPQTAKDAAPDAFNQWGVVKRAEDIDGHDQLLTIDIFSDGSSISVPNRYVLPIGNANAFSTPQAMVRECVKWHAVTELNLRQTQYDAAGVGEPQGEIRDHVLGASSSAFYARAEKLGISISQLHATAKEGFIFWTTHRDELQNFDESDAPLYVFLDTRVLKNQALSQVASLQSQAGRLSVNGSGDAPDGDVEMQEEGAGEGSSNPGSGDSTRLYLSGSTSRQANESKPSESATTATEAVDAAAVVVTETVHVDANSDQTVRRDDVSVGATEPEKYDSMDPTIAPDVAESSSKAVEAAALGEETTPAVAIESQPAEPVTETMDMTPTQTMSTEEVELSTLAQGRRKPEAADQNTSNMEANTVSEPTDMDSDDLAVNDQEKDQANAEVVTSSGETTEPSAMSAENTEQVQQDAASSSVPALTGKDPICREKRKLELDDAEATSPSASLSFEATFVDAVEVTLVSPTPAADQENVQHYNRPEAGDDTLSHDSKRQKLSQDDEPRKAAKPPSFVLGPSSIGFSHHSGATSTNTFAREKESFGMESAMKKQQPTITRKQRKLAKFSVEMQQELERQAMLFLTEEEKHASQPRSSRRKSAYPKHSAAFPFASSSESFRPPYYRPSIVFSRVRGRRMDGVSRILLSQDKRNIKCFVQGTEENRCMNEPTVTTTASASVTISRSKTSFVTVDLMSVNNFRSLEMLIRTRMIAAVEQNDSYLREIYDVNADIARQLIAEKKKSLPMDLYYCSYDGRRYKVQSKQDDWLCFCANVCHLTAVIPLQA